MTGLVCPTCSAHAQFDVARSYLGCQQCASERGAVNFTVDYHVDRAVARAALEDPARESLWDFRDLLPPVATTVSLGEGWTPLVRIGDDVPAGHRFKLESANPTWSHKDRLCALAAAHAVSIGAPGLVAASTGNHAASTAAYAARAGMPCTIVTLATVPDAMLEFMASYGAQVVVAPDLETRNEVMLKITERDGYYPVTNLGTPPVGSTPFGVDGYQTLAWELWLQYGRQVPDVVVIPTAYGDCLAGVYRGFARLVEWELADQLPRLVAAEVSGALAHELGHHMDGVGESAFGRAFSIATRFATRQAVDALQATSGRAVPVGFNSLDDAQRTLARRGLFVEGASAAAFAAYRQLVVDRVVDEATRVAVVLTSTGLKDPAALQMADDAARVDAVEEVLPRRDGVSIVNDGRAGSLRGVRT